MASIHERSLFGAKDEVGVIGGALLQAIGREEEEREQEEEEEEEGTMSVCSGVKSMRGWCGCGS